MCDAGGRECGLCGRLIYRSRPFRLWEGVAPSLTHGPPPAEMDVYFREDAGIIAVEGSGEKALGYFFAFVSLLSSRQGFWRLAAPCFDFSVCLPVV